MSRSLAVAASVCAAFAAIAAAGAAPQPAVETIVGPARLVSAGFGYAVVSRTVQLGTPPFVRTTLRLFVDDAGRWRDVTPPTSLLRRDGIDAIEDVAFVDRRHGWLAAYDCARAAVYLYRTADGGRSWRFLGAPGSHSCGGGPSFLSFVDDERGWLEPVSPNGPAGVLLGTMDGGRTWRRLASGPAGPVRQPGLPCLAPIRFVSAVRGFMARCADGGLYATDDGGRRWHRVAVPMQHGASARLDLPWLSGAAGVVAATIGTRPPSESGWSRAVVFAVSRDGGREWRVGATRPVAHCPLRPFGTDAWPAAVAGPSVWWIVAGGAVQLTTDAGRTWLTHAAHGLPTLPCSVVAVSAAGPDAAWVVARTGGRSTALFATADGGRSWRRVGLP